LNTLSKEELNRYSRHLNLKGFGKDCQIKLKTGSVLVIGAGGLGCPVLLYLAAAGVGRIGIVDFDAVQESNLQRQILFTAEDVFKNKAEAAKTRLSLLNSFIRIDAYPFQLTSSNALELLNGYDVVIDGSDNFPTRYLVNDACVLLNKPLVYGSVLEFEGQVAVFNVFQNNHHSANYRDLYSAPPPHDVVPNCETAGVLGVLPGIIGIIQANEAIKLLTGIGEVIADKLILIDSLSMDINTVSIKNKNSREHIRKLIDYEDFCGTQEKTLKPSGMKEVTVHELLQLKQAGENFQLIDVREEHEFETGNLEGELIPLSQIPDNIERINKQKQVIIHCKSGSRSSQAIQWLEKTYSFENLYNLKGGIAAWAREIDPSINP
jgi:adenylyltransferase/sulfurtransferase